MTINIMEVIAWKFNYQEGMTVHDGIIIEFPGGIPSQADQDKWTAEYLVQFPEGYDEWKLSMQGFRMSRQTENLITKHFNGVAGDDYDQAEYDKKIKIRGERP